MNITVYLGSTYGNDPDFKTKIAVESTNSLPFGSLGNNMGVCFIYNDLNKEIPLLTKIIDRKSVV